MKNSNEMCLPLCLPFECIEIVPEAGIECPVCSHYYVETLVILEGGAAVSLDGEEFSIRPGEAVFICPGAQHQILPAEGERTRMTLIRMDPDRIPAFPDYAPGLKQMMAEARRSRAPMHFSAAEAERMGIPRLIRDCVREMAEQDFGFDYEIRARLCLICSEVIRFWRSGGMKMPGLESQTDPIYALSGYIQDHLREGIRVDDLAEHCGLSYPWFAKKFREIYGVSCKDYIEQIRVGRVEQYLRFTGLDLTEISERTGYADCSHMIKNFKRIKGITPGQYRLRRR